MTIRQLYYTSCQQGVEGIQGFQVNATSSGIDRAQVDVGLQLSLYRPSLGAPSLPTPAELAAMPVAVGYRHCGDFAVLFHSRYLGADFTGRQGNYFAHVLVLDAPQQDLAGTLPIDTWNSGAWRGSAAAPVELPVLDAPPAGSLTTWSTGDHLRGNRLPEFGALLTAVQSALQRGGRVVLVAPTDEAVAQAVAAVTRSLPRALATAVSFVTFTSTPGDVDVLVVGTSPDVVVPVSPLGDQTVLRLGEGAAGSDVTRYARSIEGCWRRSDDEAEEAVALSSSIRPPVRAEELDALSHLVDLIVPDLPQAAPDLDVLVALRFGLSRSPAVLRAPAWARVAHHVERGTAVRDIAGWSEVLAAAEAKKLTPPPALLDAYLKAVLTAVVDDGLDVAALWMPARLTGAHEQTIRDWAVAILARSPSFPVATAVLDTLAAVGVVLADAVLRQLVERVVVPQLVDPATADTAAVEFTRMATRTPALPGMVCAELDRMCADPRGLRRVAATLSDAAADQLARHVRRPTRCALAFDIVAARAGRGRNGPLDVLDAAFRGGGLSPADVDTLVEQLWPELPSARDAVTVCRTVPAALLADSGVPALLVGRLIADAEGPGLDADDLDLADELSTEPVRQALGDGRRTVDTVRSIAQYTAGPPHSERNVDRAIDVLNAVDDVLPAIRKQALLAVGSWVCTAPDAVVHADVLAQLLAGSRGSREFVGAYRVELIEVLRNGKPAAVAAVLPALACLAVRNRDAQGLLEDTASMVLTGRSKRDREAIAKAFGSADRRLRSLLRDMGRKAPKSWPIWWDDWQQEHLRTSMVSRLIARRRSAKAVD